MLGLELFETQKKWRIVLDGNNDYRLQFAFEGGSQVGPTVWHWDPRKFKNEIDAEQAVGEINIVKIVKNL